jgi:hypothetical protein
VEAFEEEVPENAFEPITQELERLKTLATEIDRIVEQVKRSVPWAAGGSRQPSDRRFHGQAVLEKPGRGPAHPCRRRFTMAA